MKWRSHKEEYDPSDDRCSDRMICSTHPFLGRFNDRFRLNSEQIRSILTDYFNISRIRNEYLYTQIRIHEWHLIAKRGLQRLNLGILLSHGQVDDLWDDTRSNPVASAIAVRASPS